jgi:hypothetical protein
MLAKSPQSNSQSALDKEESGLACSRDERRLARLRSNPGPDEIAPPALAAAPRSRFKM